MRGGIRLCPVRLLLLAVAFALLASPLIAPNAAAAATANMAVAKSVDNPVPNVGDTVTFTVTVTNNGPDTATGVSMQDTLPAGLSFVSANPSQGAYDPSGGTWTVGTVTPSTAQTLQIRARVTSPNAQTNTATVTADQGDLEPGDNTASATVTPQRADL